MKNFTNNQIGGQDQIYSLRTNERKTEDSERPKLISKERLTKIFGSIQKHSIHSSYIDNLLKEDKIIYEKNLYDKKSMSKLDNNERKRLLEKYIKNISTYKNYIGSNADDDDKKIKDMYDIKSQLKDESAIAVSSGISEMTDKDREVRDFFLEKIEIPVSLSPQ